MIKETKFKGNAINGQTAKPDLNHPKVIDEKNVVPKVIDKANGETKDEKVTNVIDEVIDEVID